MTEVLQFPIKPRRGDERFYLQYPRTDRRPDKGPSHPLQDVAAEQQGQYSIQGKQASDLEWRVYQALLRAGYSAEQIQFQVGLLGGRSFRGGVIVDFVIDTAPIPTIVEVNGEYWHQGLFSADDITQRMNLIQELGDSVNIVDLWGFQLQSDDMAYDAVILNVGQG